MRRLPKQKTAFDKTLFGEEDTYLKMNLESFSNEILLDLFEYLTITQLLRVFYGLNCRFNNLLFKHLQTHDLDFRSVSKDDFDTICRQFLSSNVDKIFSLSLSDDNDTPEQTACFLAHGFNLLQFTHLRSLALYDITSVKTIKGLMFTWPHLPNLTTLRIKQSSCLDETINALTFVNSIWNIPKLVHCHLAVCLNWQLYFPAPTVISSTLKYLFISGSECNFNEMASLFKHSPCIQKLVIDIFIIKDSTEIYLSSAVPSINTLHISFSRGIREDMMINILQNIPNLTHLTIRIETIINGQILEQIIRNHLPNLKTFRFKMHSTLKPPHNAEDYVNTLIESFQSRFWIDELRLFVRCDRRDVEARYYCIDLYSLPYAFKDIDDLPTVYKSTCSNDYNYRSSYNRVRSFEYKVWFNEISAAPHMYFNNLRHLSVELPANDLFWLMVPRFDRLTSLRVSWSDDNAICVFQLQNILDRAPRLHSIQFLSWPFFCCEVPPFQNRHASVCQLDVRASDLWYSNKECVELGASPLGIQCKVLFIRVQNQQCVLDLINNMPNLQALFVRFGYDGFCETPESLLAWLRCNLPSTCTITKDKNYDLDIHLWIR